VILGERIRAIQGFDYIVFILPGLIVLGTISNAFENASFSIFHGRWNRYIEEVLTSPLSHGAMVVAYVLSSAFRGLLVGTIIAAIGVAFLWLTGVSVTVARPLFLVAFMLVVSLLFAIPGAYAFARLDFPGRKVLFYTAVFTIMFPWVVLTIPVYEVFFFFDLVNTLTGITIALSIFVLPQNIWLLQGFFRQGIPENIEEAALIDGHNELTAFLRIVLPLSLPAVAAAGLFAFLTAWNNFLWVFVLTSDEANRTATVAIYYILGSDVLREWNVLMASLLLLVAPPVIFYGLSRRYVGEGLGGTPGR
jgi:multiple sugar transport system permease protein